MTPCSACTNDSTVKVHGYDLCPEHASGMMTTVLTGDYTPVGYIMAAACGLVIEPPEVAKPSSFRGGNFMRHGVIPNGDQGFGLDSRGQAPTPVTGGQMSEFRTVRVSSGKWRGE